MAIQGPTSNENTLSPLREQLLPYLHYESTFVTNRKTKKKEEIRKYYILDENGIKYYCNGTLGGGGTSFVTLATGPGNTKVAFKTFVMDLVAGSPLQREKELLEREGSLLSTATLKSPSDDPMFEPTVLIVPYFEGAMLSKSLYEHAKDIPNKQSLPIAKKKYHRV